MTSFFSLKKRDKEKPSGLMLWMGRAFVKPTILYEMECLELDSQSLYG